MPKAKKNTNKSKLKDKKPAAEADLKETIHAAILTALGKAEAEEAGQRQIACSDLNTLLEHPDTMGLLSTVEGLDGVVKCLSDEEVVVRLEAAALTHEILSHEDVTMAVRLVKCELPQHLATGLQKTYEALAQQLKLGHPTQTGEMPLDKTMEQTIHAWNALCEQTDIGVDAALAAELPEKLFACLQAPALGLELRAAAVLCLMTLLEDNDELLNTLSQAPQHLELLHSCMTGDVGTAALQIPVAGCLLMLNQLNEAHGASFTQVTMSILSHDTLEEAGRCIPHLASITDTYNRAIDSPKKDEYEQLLSTCRTQGQALELLANVVASLDPEEGHWLNTLLQDADLLRLVCQQLNTLPAEQSAVAIAHGRFGQRMVQSVTGRTTKALACVNNLAMAEVLNVLDVEQLLAIWSRFSSPELDLLIDEEVIYTRWALLKCLMDAPAAKSALTVEPELFTHFQAVLPRADADVQTAIVGTFGCLAQCPQLAEHTMSMIGVVVQLLTQESDLWVRLEALDAIIDIFSDDDKNGMFETLQLLPLLKQAVPYIKAAQAAGLSEEQQDRLAEMQDNLPRFVAYKQG